MRCRTGTIVAGHFCICPAANSVALQVIFCVTRTGDIFCLIKFQVVCGRITIIRVQWRASCFLPSTSRLLRPLANFSSASASFAVRRSSNLIELWIYDTEWCITISSCIKYGGIGHAKRSAQMSKKRTHTLAHKNCNELFPVVQFPFCNRPTDRTNEKQLSFFVSFQFFCVRFCVEPLSGLFVCWLARRRQMALYKHHLRSSVRFFIAPQATTGTNSARRMETSKEKQLSSARHKGKRKRIGTLDTRHNLTVDWLQFCILGTHFRFCHVTDACDTNNDNISHVWPVVSVATQFGQKQKFSSFSLSRLPSIVHWTQNSIAIFDEIVLAQLLSDPLSSQMNASFVSRISPNFPGVGVRRWKWIQFRRHWARITNEAHKKNENVYGRKPGRK